MNQEENISILTNKISSSKKYVSGKLYSVKNANINETFFSIFKNLLQPVLTSFYTYEKQGLDDESLNKLKAYIYYRNMIIIY